MSQLDALITRIQAGQELVLESAKDPSIRSGDGLKSLSTKPLSNAQIATLLSEITPADKREELKAGRHFSFVYSLNSKSYNVSYMQHGEQVRALIVIAGAPDAAASAAPAQKAPAPSPVATPNAPVTAAKPGTEPEINLLFRKMIAAKASDLHITSGHKPILRAGGDMVDMPDQPVIPPDKMKELLYAILPPYNKAQFEETHDTDFPYEIEGLARFRANIFKDRYGIGGVFRQIPIEIVSAEKLGLSKEILDLCYLSKGLVLVTGPTGSGKSTTLCALIDYINRNRKLHIITIEDPIEFVHERKQCLINQREVHVHTKSFSAALRAALREDPDIMLVGEMRDLETISIAIETAETGHLVFGTLHTTTAASTVDRIIDQFPADRQPQIRTMLASSLKGVVAQTLCKKIGGGRVAAQEILFVNSAVANLIRDGKIFQIPSVMQTSKQQGMILLNDALIDLVVAKKVTPEDAYIKSVDKVNFVSALKAKGVVLKLQTTTEQTL